MKRIITSSVLVLSFILCVSAQQVESQASQSSSVKTTQTVNKNTLNKRTIIIPKAPTNWSKIKDLFR
jgi:ABC-type Fe3+-hydroxamate transport system substrate-binding protein